MIQSMNAEFAELVLNQTTHFLLLVYAAEALCFVIKIA